MYFIPKLSTQSAIVLGVGAFRDTKCQGWNIVDNIHEVSVVLLEGQKQNELLALDRTYKPLRILT